ncbi:alpha/beta hydrolase, partial [Nocardia gipuzkoensis]
NTVVGYSYGSTVVGTAAGHGRTLNADDVVFVASLGTTVERAEDLSLTGVRHEDVAAHVYATKAINDPVPEYGHFSLGTIIDSLIHYDTYPGQPQIGGSADEFGPDPTDSDYHARTFESDPGSTSELGLNGKAHGEYWNRDDKHVNRALEGMGDVIGGHGEQATRIQAAPPPVAETQPVPTPPPPPPPPPSSNGGN